jgi:nucleolar protein 53
LIELPAVVEPHQGASYNPPVSAHQELLRTAHEIEEKKVKLAEEHKDIREKIVLARQSETGDLDEGLPTGMKLDQFPDESAGGNEQVTGDSDVIVTNKSIPERKTRQQRKKAEKQRAEVGNRRTYLFSYLTTQTETGTG